MHYPVLHKRVNALASEMISVLRNSFPKIFFIIIDLSLFTMLLFWLLLGIGYKTLSIERKKHKGGKEKTKEWFKGSCYMTLSPKIVLSDPLYFSTLNCETLSIKGSYNIILAILYYSYNFYLFAYRPLNLFKQHLLILEASWSTLWPWYYIYYLLLALNSRKTLKLNKRKD